VECQPGAKCAGACRLTRKKSKAGVRDKLTHKSDLEAFRSRWPGFGKQNQNIQRALLRGIKHAFNPARQHKADQDFFWWHYPEIEKDFRRGKFDEINDQLRIFEVSANYSMKDGETRRYRLTPDAERIYLDTLDTKRRGQLGKLLDANGDVVRTLPGPVAAKDVNGNTAKVWPGEPVPRLVPVQIEVVDRLVENLANPSGDLFFQASDSSRRERTVAAGEIRKMATTSVAGRGFVAHRYQEAGTGRLTAIGSANLQNTPRTVRKAALIGLWDYDFENCHYAIFQQMAARYGCGCPTIKHYLANKRTVREDIAADIGVEIKRVKRALIAVIYGARATESRYAALYKEMGYDSGRTRSLLQHPLFIGLHRDVKIARNAILSSWPVRRRRLINEAGKGISIDARKEQRMAHLLQGAEAIILRAALRQYSDKIVLLVHDGFVTTEAIDEAVIESVVEDETGYRMQLAGERIVMPPDFDISKT